MTDNTAAFYNELYRRVTELERSGWQVRFDMLTDGSVKAIATHHSGASCAGIGITQNNAFNQLMQQLNDTHNLALTKAIDLIETYFASGKAYRYQEGYEKGILALHQLTDRAKLVSTPSKQIEIWCPFCKGMFSKSLRELTGLK